jgi:septal ring factor EnvC (AmiA/AmiB activator)
MEENEKDARIAQLEAEVASLTAFNQDVQAQLARSAARVWELREEIDAAERRLTAGEEPAP